MDETSTSARQQQEAAVRRFIMGCNRASYYEILGVERTALVLDINKAYRKIAKAVHPDKNQCSDAEEAFKRVGKAYEVLSDETQRRLYDQGSLNNNYTEQHEDDANREEEFKRWDDLFRRAYQDYQQRENASRQENFDWSERWEYGSRNQQITEVVWTILRILFIFGVIYSAVFIALFLAPGPEYSLKSNEIFIVPRTTNRLSIKYYVTRKFIKIPAHIRASVDEPVEQEYLANLQEKCDTENNRKNNSSPTWIFCTPRGTCGTKDDMKTPSCDEMKKHNETLFKHKRRKFS